MQLDKVTVRGESVPGQPGVAPASSEGIAPSLAAAVDAAPGLAMHHMGASAAEPLLRGLGSDHVVTALDGLPLPNASPTRTASPLALIGGGLAAGFTVSKAVPSVTLGPPANAGYIVLSTADPDAVHGPMAAYGGAEWDPNRDGGERSGRRLRPQRHWSFRAAAAAHTLGDYTSGDGTVIPAKDRNEGAALELGWQPDTHTSSRLGALFSRQELAVNSALPLDTRDTDRCAFTGGYSWAASAKPGLTTRFGVGIPRPISTIWDGPLPH